MNSNANQPSQIFRILVKIYRIALISPRLLIRAIAKPNYIPLCLWAFQKLWQIDSQLKTMALEALKKTTDSQPNSLSVEQKRAIRQRAVAIAWTAKIHPLRPKCLHRSLVLYQWLQQQGIDAQLEIGWGKNIGHAWVTYDGKVLNDRADIANITPRLVKVTNQS